MDEIITEPEWFNRMLIQRIYEVLTINLADGTTRVIHKETGEIYDASVETIGKQITLRLKKLE